MTPPDYAERERALDPSVSFLVEAPAGSGKTTLLVRRYLSLLGQVQRPESVVAMTFTRKAAADMRARVLTVLQGDDPLAAAVRQRDKDLGWGLAHEPARLSIQTIDSLCAQLTRQMPVVSHLGGSPSVVEYAQQLYRSAARRTLRKLAEGDEGQQSLFRRVSLHFDSVLSTAEKQISIMLAKREQWRGIHASSESDDVEMFCHLLGEAERELRTVFREAGEVDFTAITRAAIDALGTDDAPSDLLYWLDYRIEHLLVDEFQDTSGAQYELLRSLTAQWSDGDNRTLFLVGDPMQSIYRFREADVSLFLRCWENEELGSVRLQRLRLLANFRSTPEIVQWTQRTFETIMTRDDAPNGGVKLRPAQATHAHGGNSPQLVALVGDKTGTAEASAIVDILNSEKDRGATAILVRSRSQLPPILRALRGSNIAYEALEIDQLTESQHILDVLSLTRALVHIGDRTAWLACLRAPWCGLTLASFTLLAERDERTILQILGDREKVWALPLAQRERLIRVAEILSGAVERVGRSRLRTLVEATWLQLGGPAMLGKRSELEDVEAFLDLLDKSEQGGTIRDFSLLQTQLDVLYARANVSEDCVKVMTIHTAKGLEFDTVILPGLGRPAQSDQGELLIWSDDSVAAKPPRNDKDPAYEAIKSVLRARAQNELKRLLYVAGTRAKSELFLLGNVELKGDRSDITKPRDGTFLHLLWSTVEEEFRSVFRRQTPQQTALPFGEAVPATALRRLPAHWHEPIFDAPVRWTPPLQTAAASARTVTYEWVSDTGRHVGTVVHAVLKRMAGEGCADWSVERVDAMAPLFRSELARLGVDEAEVEGAVTRAARALVNTLQSERGRWILGSHAWARSEWAIGGTVGARLVNGSVDRAFRDDDGRLWIVDFKTSEHQGAHLDQFLREEERRYRDQLENYARLIAKSHAGRISLGLYFPLHDAWREWEWIEQVSAAS